MFLMAVQCDHFDFFSSSFNFSFADIIFQFEDGILEDGILEVEEDVGVFEVCVEISSEADFVEDIALALGYDSVEAQGNELIVLVDCLA